MTQGRRSSDTFAYGTVLAVQGTRLRVRQGPSAFGCQLAAPLTPTDVQVGDTVVLVNVQDQLYAIAVLRPATTQTSAPGASSLAVLGPTGTPALAVEMTVPELPPELWEVGSGATSVQQVATNAVASGVGSHATNYATATGVGSHAEAYGTAEGEASHAEGQGTASAYGSHAEGGGESSGNYSHAEGWSTATGEYSHAEGGAEATGESSHAEGEYSEAVGKASHVEGTATYAEGAYSHAEGSGSCTDTTAIAAHAEGEDSVATGPASHAEGTSWAVGEASHSEGINSKARQTGGHAGAAGSFGNDFGSAQATRYVLRCVTTNATPTEAWITGNVYNYAGDERLLVPLNTLFSFKIVVAAATEHLAQGAGYEFAGVIKNAGGTTALVGDITKDVLAEDDPAWDCNVTADNTNDALIVTVTGKAATTIRWVAVCYAAEVAFP